ncbi:MAG: hypothetical protein ABIP77_10095, partial [Candidatus Limnocylindrales bacterium]
LSIALLDGWLDRRLPHAVAGRKGPVIFYATVTLVGAVLVLPFVLLIFLTSDEYQLPLRAGYALLVVGLCSATWWALRVRGRATGPRGLMITARAAVLVAVMLGVLTSLPHISRALGTPT